MSVTPTTVLTWTCVVCNEPIADGDGFLGIDPTTVVAHRPARAPWFALHQACDPDPEGPGYWLDIAEIRTANGLAAAHERIGRKTWMKWTDWTAILSAQGVLAPIVQPFNPAAPLAPGIPTNGNGFLTWLFKQADTAGYGIANGATFEAYPGMADAAAEYVGQLVDRLFKED